MHSEWTGSTEGTKCTGYKGHRGYKKLSDGKLLAVLDQL